MSSLCPQPSEYIPEIADHIVLLEQVRAVMPVLIDVQTEIRWSLRLYILNFLILVHLQFGLNKKTIFLAIQILDHYSSRRIIKKDHLQLAGLTALWIASKNHDDKSAVLTLLELDKLLQRIYGPDLFVKMEQHILNNIEWFVHNPTMDDCLEVCITNTGLGEVPGLETMASFLCELACYDRSMLFFSSSLKAVTSILVAANILGDGRAMELLKKDMETVLQNPLFPFVKHFDELLLVLMRKIATLFLKLLLRPIPKSLLTKYSVGEGLVFNKIKAFISVFEDLLSYNKLVPSIVVEYFVHDLNVLHQRKANMFKLPLREYFTTLQSKTSFPLMLTNFVLGIEMAPVLTLFPVLPQTPRGQSDYSPVTHTPMLNGLTLLLVSSSISLTFSSPGGYATDSEGEYFELEYPRKRPYED